MRGGTANCSVIISDEPVGSPIVNKPDVLVAMNLPSLDKYEDAVVPGGIIFVDSTLISRKVARTDVKTVYLPATGLANDKGFSGLANMILMGKIIATCEGVGKDNIEAALKKVVSARHQDLYDANLAAIKLGFGE